MGSLKQEAMGVTPVEVYNPMRDLGLAYCILDRILEEFVRSETKPAYHKDLIVFLNAHPKCRDTACAEPLAQIVAFSKVDEDVTSAKVLLKERFPEQAVDALSTVLCREVAAHRADNKLVSDYLERTENLPNFASLQKR